MFNRAFKSAKGLFGQNPRQDGARQITLPVLPDGGARTSTLDPVAYRARYPDCCEMSDIEAVKHYETFGMKEGRVANPLVLRENFIEGLKKKFSILEIGPFCNPAVSGAHVKYFEILDQAALVERAKLHNLPTDRVPIIHFLSPDGDLSVVVENFECCFSSHVIEHQPDLVRHLQAIEKILLPGGEYHLLIPDHRYCFDHYLRPSTIADVLDAHHAKRFRNEMRAVIEHMAMTTHNDPVRHWNGDHGESYKTETHIERVRNATQHFIDANGAYLDTHAWQFTPDSFFEIVTSLNRLGLLKLTPRVVNDTPFGRFEFSAVLTKHTLATQ